MHKVLVTKKLTKEQQALAKDYGLEVFVQEFIKITLEYDTIIPPKVDAWIFTSSNAAKYISAHIDEIPEKYFPKYIVTIGPATASHLKHIGIPIYTPDYGTAENVVAQVKQLQCESAVFFSGNLRKNVIPESLSDELDFTEFQVYHTELLDVPLDVSEMEAVAFFSPSAVRGFVKSNQLEGQKVIAVGTTTKRAVQDLLGIRAGIAASPSMEDVLFALKMDVKG